MPQCIVNYMSCFPKRKPTSLSSCMSFSQEKESLRCKKVKEPKKTVNGWNWTRLVVYPILSLFVRGFTFFTLVVREPSTVSGGPLQTKSGANHGSKPSHKISSKRVTSGYKGVHHPKHGTWKWGPPGKGRFRTFQTHQFQVRAVSVPKSLHDPLLLGTGLRSRAEAFKWITLETPPNN